MSSFWWHFFLSPSEQTEGPTEGSGSLGRWIKDCGTCPVLWPADSENFSMCAVCLLQKNLPRPLFLPPFCPSSMTHLVGRWRCRSPPPSWPGPWRVPAGWGRSSPPRPARSGTSDSGLCRLKEGEEKKNPSRLHPPSESSRNPILHVCICSADWVWLPPKTPIYACS